MPGARRIARVDLAKGESGVCGFVPAMIIPEQPKKSPEPACGRMEAVSVNGRRIIVEPEVDLEAPLRVMRGWERWDDPNSDGGASVAGDGSHRHALRLSQPCSTPAGNVEEGSAEGFVTTAEWERKEV
ncbi:hypothetical protein X734_22950 [Mesorhizobium sp. L2C084A000]|nr:hypothetical protein X734_22950 [Mesorhizobium sp. L2C084A000]